MDQALETLAAAELAAEAATPDGERDPAHAAPSHTQAECLNCGASQQGPYCHTCGQGADDHHRSIGHLLWEAVEGFTHLDGRLAQTLPALLFHPGRLARDHIEGRRQRHVPPFRLFLITLLVFMFAAEFAVGHGKPIAVTSGPGGKATHQVSLKELMDSGDMAEARATLQRNVPHADLVRWTVDRVERASGNREYFLMLVFEWAHRLAVLLLPILAGLLTLGYAYKRQFYIYDHLVVSMQYLSFCFLVWAVVWVLPEPAKGVAFLAATAWTPFNLYLILRTAYGSRRLGAAAKALAFWFATVTAFAGLLCGLLAFALVQM